MEKLKKSADNSILTKSPPDTKTLKFLLLKPFTNTKPQVMKTEASFQNKKKWLLSKILTKLFSMAVFEEFNPRVFL